ncbi:MAG: hypothetical protein WC635_12330 [Bacteriovorax sp.]|jgi:hypothetical protein
MSFRVFFIAAIFTANVSGVLADDLLECEKKSMTCDFYSCVEKEIPCGKDGYFLGFGERFCRRFDNILDKLSPEGKSWFFTARQCLTENILSLNNYNNCQEIEEKSYNDHKPCYINSGYCDLPIRDKVYIMKVISPLLLKKNVLIMGHEIQMNCMKQSREMP